MNKTSTFTALALAAALLGTSTACQSSGNTNIAVTQGANSSPAVSTTPAAAAEPAAELNTLAANTPTEAYKAAYKARQEKDIETLKRLLSKEILEFFSEMGEAGGKSIDDELKELTEMPQAKTAEARNEKIVGDTATIEYLDEKGKWRPMDFVREDGMWKLTIGKEDSEPMDKDAPAGKK